MSDDMTSFESVDIERLARSIKSSVDDLYKRAELPANFLDILTEGDDDWSFIVKGNAILEAAITDLLVNALGRRSLEKFIAKKPLNFKLGMAKDLGLAHSPWKGFVDEFSSLRNGCVHDVQKLSFFSLKDHIDTLGNSDADKLFKAAKLGGFLVVDAEAFHSNPKPILAKALESVLGTLNLQIRLLEAQQGALKAFLMCKPKSEPLELLWNLAKEVAPDV